MVEREFQYSFDCSSVMVVMVIECALYGFVCCTQAKLSLALEKGGGRGGICGGVLLKTAESYIGYYLTEIP